MKPVALLKAVGGKIRVIRKSKELSQEKLAELSGLHPTFVSNLENGKLNCSILSYFKIAEALDTPLAKLFTFSPVSKPKRPKKKI
jgi:transcriptional regulator with XRE-family HTH domain